MKNTDTPTAEQYQAEIADLRARLEESEETLRAIREGEVDAVIVSGSKGDRVFALSEADNLHRLMVETMNEAGLAATPDGLLVFCNARAAALLGRAKEQLLGHDLVAFAAPSDAERVRQLFRTASTAPADALTTAGVIPAARRSGTITPVTAIASAVRSSVPKFCTSCRWSRIR